MAFGDDFLFAYNETVTVGGLLEVFPKIEQIAITEEGFRRAYKFLKSAVKSWGQLGGTTKEEKLYYFYKELCKVFPTFLRWIEKASPELYHALTDRYLLQNVAGKTLGKASSMKPSTAVTRLVGQDLKDVIKKLALKVYKTMLEALPKALGKLIGADVNAAKVVMEKALTKSARLVARSGEAECLYIAAWVGVVIGSIGYAVLNRYTNVNQTLQSGFEYFWDWKYGVYESEARNARMQGQLDVKRLRQQLRTLHDSTLQEANDLGAPIPDVTKQKMKALIIKLNEAEMRVGA